MSKHESRAHRRCAANRPEAVTVADIRDRLRREQSGAVTSSPPEPRDYDHDDGGTAA